MPRRTESLYKLQRVDSQILIRKRRYQEIGARLGESEALHQARTMLQSAQAELTHWRTTLREREQEAAVVTAKQIEAEGSLYSGRIKDPKQLNDLQKECQYLTRRKAALEESQLEAMVKVEEMTTMAAVAQEQFTVMEGTWRTENTALAQEFDEVKRELAQLLAKRKLLVQAVAAGDLEEYESIRRIRDGVAVTMLQDDACQICRVQVPTRTIDRARDTEELMYCIGCDRILYVPKG